MAEVYKGPMIQDQIAGGTITLLETSPDMEQPLINSALTDDLKASPLKLKNDELNFYSLRQTGIAAVEETVVFNSPPPHINKDIDRTKLTKVRLEQQRLKQLLGISKMGEISALINDPEERARRTERAYKLLAGSYDIKGETEEETTEKVKATIAEIGILVDSTIDDATKDFPPPLVEQGQDSVIRKIHNPVDLALAMFDNSLEPLDRFRAKRKLVLMGLGGSVDLREREVKTDEAYQKFNTFLEEYVLNPRSDEDKKEKYLLSTHDPETFATNSVTLISKEEKDAMMLEPGQKLTRIQRRTFTVSTPKGPKEIGMHIAVTTGGVQFDADANEQETSEDNPITRRKKKRRMILKLLRKGHENPALAVDDQIGVMTVFNNKHDLRLFREHLSISATQAGCLLGFEETEDTLNGGVHNAASEGSSKNLQWFKTFLKMDGMRPEFIGHTLETIPDYLYKRGLSHPEYSNQRFIESGVMELLFPPDKHLYNYNPAKVKAYAMSKVRQKIEDPNVIM